MSSANQIVAEIFNAALKAVDPYESVKLHTDKIRQFYQDNNFKKLIVVGFGKAASAMAKAIEDELPDLIDTGIVVTKYGHAENTEFGVKSSELGPKKLKKIKVIEAGHPVPDENGLNATEEIIKLLKNADENTLVVCLISGGGSALLAAPCEDISLDEKQKITQLLLKAGADINELNTVRKHISNVKGGRLAEIAYPARIISLILSDVIGDKLDVIASGPTSPDKTTYNDALQVLKKYALMDKVPRSIIEILNKGVNNIIPETPKDDNPAFEKVENIIIGSSRKTLEAAKTKAESFGLQTEVISSEITGEAREVGRWLAIKTRDALSVRRDEKICLISGGETTVTVKGNGLGGRNMELALSFAIEIDGIDGITLLSAGTDGTDGPTDAAGAIVDGQTVARAKAIGLDPGTYLENNDSYNFFKQINELFITGPTGTNVMDIQIMVIG
ncbi:MAG: glycerate kinase [Nitrospirae bacterium]|nr:glycerate kinase [Nitrospirota bacterium]